MSYEVTNCVPCEGTAIQSKPIPPLSSMMDAANFIAEEILTMVYKINTHMFGIGKPNEEKAISPQCFRDALSIQLATLNAASKELASIMEALGV